MNISALIVAAVIILLGIVGYNYWNQAEPASNKLDNAMHELDKGNVGNAIDEMNNETHGDKVMNDIKKAVTPPVPLNQ